MSKDIEIINNEAAKNGNDVEQYESGMDVEKDDNIQNTITNTQELDLHQRQMMMLGLMQNPHMVNQNFVMQFPPGVMQNQRLRGDTHEINHMTALNEKSALENFKTQVSKFNLYIYIIYITL